MFDLWLEDGFPYVSVRLFEDVLIYMLDGVHASCCWNISNRGLMNSLGVLPS
jgi:hypothetical protein